MICTEVNWMEWICNKMCGEVRNNSRHPLWLVCLVLLVTMVGGVTSGRHQTDILLEFCQDESFNANCNDNQVLLMKAARYGRMKIGRCVTRDLGYLGCAVDASRFMDSRCSGHQKCNLSIMNPDLRGLSPCVEDVTWYLEASHNCVEVETRGQHECRISKPVELTKPSGLLSSEIAMKTGVGSLSCPWKIVAPKGQTINITLYNFMDNPTDGANGGSTGSIPCVTVARISDTYISACANKPRISPVFQSRSNRLKVTFKSDLIGGATTGTTQFLLKYELSGCPDIVSKDDAEIERNGDTITAKCPITGDTWFLTCEGTRWSGILGNCSRATDKPWPTFPGDDNFPYGILIVVAVGVALGIFLGGSLLLVVSIYMKRRRMHHDARTALHPDAYHGTITSEEYYRKQQELTEIEQKDELFNTAQTGRMPNEEYKITEYRPPFSQNPYPPGTHPGPRNMHHVYESPKFS